jgi:peptide/nickel transport system substrate-binding protein
MAEQRNGSAGDVLSQRPVCAGPYAITERVPQDHITVDRFAGYWNAGAIHVDRIVYHPITDSTVRLVNLQSGRLQIIDQLAPTDVATVKSNPQLRVMQHAAAGYRTLEFNVAHGARANGPLGKDARIRQALAKSIDRNAINQVVFNGLFVANNQTQILQVANSPIDGQIGEVIQSMAGEAGFDVKLHQVETNAGNQQTLAGDFDVALLTWSGRADPDANLAIFLACNGPFNFGRYCNPKMDALLAAGRATTDNEKRAAIYRQVVDLYTADAPQIILYNYTWIWGLSARLHGFIPNEDGLIRPQGLMLQP